MTCHMDFPSNWGLGSSSTLINNIADWAEVDAFDLLENSFGGSGYDVAVAMEKKPIIYERHQGEPYHEEVEFSPSFKDSLWFVHLGVKEDTATAVAGFLEDDERGFAEIPPISRITEATIACQELQEFEELMTKHNQILSSVLGKESAQQRFSDYTAGVVKYLGAWGGDFMLATGSESDMEYFKSQGFTDILPYSKMIAL